MTIKSKYFDIINLSAVLVTAADSFCEHLLHGGPRVPPAQRQALPRPGPAEAQTQGGDGGPQEVPPDWGHQTKQ